MAFDLSDLMGFVPGPYGEVLRKYRAVDISTVDSAMLSDIAKTLGWEGFLPKHAKVLESMLKKQDFSGSVSDFVMSGRLIPMLLNKDGQQQGSSSRLIRCKFCDQPNLVE